MLVRLLITSSAIARLPKLQSAITVANWGTLPKIVSNLVGKGILGKRKVPEDREVRGAAAIKEIATELLLHRSKLTAHSVEVIAT